mmetsp:Transcript_46623/g.129771  ORF Transcript_46623/g.129771 Transcript_46623/m.129771 type:complete len:313 (+) Transcript_46623:947-1885(+)
MFLQQLVGVVDEKLLQGVRLEELEAENVEHPDERHLPLPLAGNADDGVDALDNEAEDRRVEVPRECVAALRRFGDWQRRADDPLAGRFHGLVAPCRLERQRVHGKKLARDPHGTLEARGLGALGVVGRSFELNVAEVQHGRQGSQQVRGLRRGNAEVRERGEGLPEVSGFIGPVGPNVEALRLPQVLEVFGSTSCNPTQLHVATSYRSPKAASASAPVLFGGAALGGVAGLLRAGREHLVEDVEASFATLLACYADFLEQVRVGVRAHEPGRRGGLAFHRAVAGTLAAAAELQFDVLPEARGVVVAQRLRVA